MRRRGVAVVSAGQVLYVLGGTGPDGGAQASTYQYDTVNDVWTTKADMIAALEEAANGPMKGILGVTHEPLVSMDFKGDPRSSIIDALASDASGNLVKVITWYDNEWGYSVRCAELTKFMGDML